MNEHNEHFIHMAFDTVLFLLAVTTLIFLILSFTDMETTGKDTIDTKTNVAMAYGDVVTDSLRLSKSDTAYQICQYCEDDSIILIVQGHKMTATEKERIIMNNALADSYLGYDDYIKTVIINNDGSIQQIEFTNL